MSNQHTREPGIRTFCRTGALAAIMLLLMSVTVVRLSAGDVADLVITNANIVTVDEIRPHAEAIAVVDDRIAAVGSANELAVWIGPKTRVMDLGGKTVVPGFIEGHGHFLGLGHSKMILDLSTADTWNDIVQQVAKAADSAPVGAWILGRGWHQSKWSRKPASMVEGNPTHHALSRLTPDHPVLLTHASGHMCIVNARAMQMAGLDQDTKAPEGGEILRDAAGNPTGVLRENASGLVERVHAREQRRRSQRQIRDELLTAIRLASDECLRHGVTSFQDAGASYAMVDTYKELAEGERLPVRIWAMLSESNNRLAEKMDAYRMIGAGNHHLTVRAVKRLVDGALGSHGAWLLAPYDDLPASCGLNTLSLEDLRQTAQLAMDHDFQLCVHAIGDRANREVLDIYESVQAGRRDVRWRVEHAQHLHLDDIPRFAELGVIASMQAVHATSDGPFVIERLGERRSHEGAYVWQSLRKSGAVVSNGTDVPVESVCPFAGLYSAITRKMRNGVAFYPEQCLTRKQALRSYTLDAAYAAFEEDLKGSLTPHKLADMVVLSQDIMTVVEEKIPQTKVLFTILGGRVVFDAEKR